MRLTVSPGARVLLPAEVVPTGDTVPLTLTHGLSVAMPENDWEDSPVTVCDDGSVEVKVTLRIPPGQYHLRP